MMHKLRPLRFHLLEDRSVPAGGLLDPTFGDGGVTQDDWDATASHVSDVAVDALGRVVVAGGGFDGGGTFVVARYLPDGSPDPTFAGDGRPTSPFPGFDDAALGVAVDPLGRVVVAGSAYLDGVGAQMVVARYLDDGTLDPTFSGDGLWTGRPEDSFADLADIAIDADGRIVTVGSSEAVPHGPAFALLRFLDDGTPDPTFGAGGTVITRRFGESTRLGSVAIDPAGRLVVGGSSAAEGRFETLISRYLPDGALDPTLGDGGLVRLAVGDTAVGASTLAVDADGNVLLGGHYFTPQGHLLYLRRYDDLGRPDRSFGVEGGITAAFADASAFMQDVFVDDNGRIVAAGRGLPASGNQFLALARFLADGSLDPSFGDGGVARTDFGLAGLDNMRLAESADGRFVAAALADDGDDRRVSLAQYVSDDGAYVRFEPTSTVFTEGGPAIALDPSLQILGPVRGQLVGATVRIRNHWSIEDVIGFDPPAGITATFDAATGVLTFAGAASRADYEAALRSVTFANGSDAAFPVARTFAVTLADDGATTPMAVTARQVRVAGVNDAPYLVLLDPAPLVPAVPGFPVLLQYYGSDPERGRLTYGMVGGPAGASVDPATGAFSWTPDGDVPPGDYTFQLFVEDDGTPALRDTETVTVRLRRAHVLGGPFVGLLAVGGTESGDHIVVEYVPEGGWRVAINGEVVGEGLVPEYGRILVRGLGGDDRIAMGRDDLGSPTVYGGSGDDTLRGGASGDVLDGGEGDDRLIGGGGDDLLLYTGGRDRLSGGDGPDELSGELPDLRWRVAAGFAGRVGDATFDGFEELLGGPGADTFFAPPTGRFRGTIDGRDGVDTVSYVARTSAVRVTLGDGQGTAFNSVTRFENVVGSRYADMIVGNPAANRIDGYGGRDVLIGSASGDTLSGGDGDDLLLSGWFTLGYDRDALLAVAREWRRPVAYATRVDHLDGSRPNGLNGEVLLDATTLTNDGAPDSVVGGSGRDWFIVGGNDVVETPLPIERVKVV